MAPAFRADQIGSLIRPTELLEARKNTNTTTANIKTVQEKCIANVIQAQLSRGIRPITTGEYEREIFYSGFYESVSGFTTRHGDFSHFRPGFPTNVFVETLGIKSRPYSVATEKITHSRDNSVYLKDWLYLRSLLPADRWADGKLTIPSPTWHFAALRDGETYSADVYATEDEFFADLVAAYRTEIQALYDAGLRNIAVDDPHLSYYADDTWTNTYPAALQRPENAGLKSLPELFDCHIAVHNAMLRGLPADLNIGVHVCRGNMPGGNFTSSGSYESIAKKMLGELDYKIFYLEFDSPRAGTLESLRYLPPGKQVVLGLVTTKHAEMEDYEVLKAKVMQAADVIAAAQGTTREDALRDCLAVSPQCGFASSSQGFGVGFTEATQWKKLELLRDLAKDIWGSE